MLLHWMYNNSNNHNSGKVYVYNIFFVGYNTQKKRTERVFFCRVLSENAI